jgi:hypothetical protein
VRPTWGEVAALVLACLAVGIMVVLAADPPW